PAGPTYVCFDAELQEMEIDEYEDGNLFPGVSAEAFAPGEPPAASPVAVSRIAEAIQQARWPVIVADFTGRSEEAFYSLAELATAFGIAVLDKRARLNVPTNLPMNLSG